jgi:hypothetical protein
VIPFFPKDNDPMNFLAHHVAVELLGHEYSPNTVFEHVCLFTITAFILGTSAYGTWTIARRLIAARRLKLQQAS